MEKKRDVLSISHRIISGFLVLAFFPLPVLPQPAIAPQEIIVKLKENSALVRFQKSLTSTMNQNSLHKSQFAPLIIEPVFKAGQNSKFSEANSIIQNIFKIAVPQDLSIAELITAIEQMSDVEYAQPNYIYKLDDIPNDPAYSEQWGLQSIQIEPAWQITRGSRNVLITVIDTGIDYNHEDLQANIFINPGEDLNHDGRFDPDDLNQIDDDGNGFTDDIQGWDFTDAPGYPDNGDYLQRDNDPMDEHGHGTAVAGIISAVGNNQTGIIGVAPQCRILNLRAGTARGLLEEEDVASAIVYAIAMGSRVINMSFGDKVVSPLFRDMIQFAARNNCTVIASAGNSATDSTHFPSGYCETIAVGAIDKENILASYSNFGVTLDVVAPGSDIYSTHLNNEYKSFSGTSAAAPFVSGIAGLLLSQNPDLSPAEIKGILTTTATDLGNPGWDSFYAAGAVNAFRALQHETATIVELTEPFMEQGLKADKITIRGTVAGPFLDHYELNYGIGINPDEYTLIHRAAHRQVVQDSLGSWDIAGLPDTSYTLQLQLVNTEQSSVEDKIIVFIDHSPPRISEVMVKPMIFQDQRSVLLEFNTDDVCQTTVYFRRAQSGNSFEKIDLKYISRVHRIHLTAAQISGPAEYYVQAINRSGLETIDDNQGQYYPFNLVDKRINTGNYVHLGDFLNPGFLLPRASDFDRDGRPELIISEYQNNQAFGPLKIYTATNTGLSLAFSTPDVAIPRDWGDSDGDGKMEILSTQGPVTTIREAPKIGDFPTIPMEFPENNFWGSRLADLDQDGKGEIIGRVNDTFLLFETIGDNQYALIDSFPNFTPGTNGTGVPHCEFGDFDNDGAWEILLGDADGDVYLYESTGDNAFRATWSDRLPLFDTIDYLSVGDYDGDGIAEFAVGCHSDPNLDLEHQYDSRHWLWRIYDGTGDDAYEVVWETRFFGFFDPKDFDSGSTSADFDGDGRDELFLCLFPQVYIIDFDSMKQNYEISWYHSPGQSNAAVLADFDNNGQPEFIFNNGNSLTAFHKQTGTSKLPAPLGLKASILDTDQVQITWHPVENATGYRVYRQLFLTEWLMLAETTETTWLDTTIFKGRSCQYSVSAVQDASESNRSPAITILTSERPTLIQAQALSKQNIQLVFSEALNENSARNIENYHLNQDSIQISSACIHQSGQTVIVTTAENLTSGQTYVIQVTHVFDSDGMPIDTRQNQASFRVSLSAPPPYLVRAQAIDRQTIRLEFNEALDQNSIRDLSQFSISPAVPLQKFTFEPQQPNLVQLQLQPPAKLGAYGREYVIKISGIQNMAGVKIRKGWGDQAALVFYATDLNQVTVFPNPYRATEDAAGITFANLTRQATIRILNISGKLITTLQETDGNGGIIWDVTDNKGRALASGIYLFYITSGNQEKPGKFAIIR